MPISKGGLNIVHFSTKYVSLCLSSFASPRDDFGSEKWHYLASYFLGNHLIKFDKRLNFICNRITSSSTPSVFYRKCLDVFFFIF